MRIATEKLQRKTRLFNLRNVIYKEEETKTEHAIGLYPRKTTYLDILTKHAQLHAKYDYLLFTFLTPHLVYINSSIFYFSHLKMMSWRHRNVVLNFSR